MGRASALRELKGVDQPAQAFRVRLETKCTVHARLVGMRLYQTCFRTCLVAAVFDGCCCIGGGAGKIRYENKNSPLIPPLPLLLTTAARLLATCQFCRDKLSFRCLQNEGTTTVRGM